jgi:hypothetical protein
MATISLKEWLETVRADLAELARQDFDYPLGTNEVREPSSTRPTAVPSQLDELYRAFDGLSLPDVHVGYFIDTASRVASAPQRGEPVFVAGVPDLSVHVFGSDGGGGRFAIGVNDGAVYYLPSSGAVRQGRFIEDSASGVRRIAANVSDFLSRLREDIHAFVQGDSEHEYMVG